jgi:cell division septation protein DedD
MRRTWGCVTAALLVLGAAPLAGQSLDRVEELARLGRSEEARDLLLEWWDEARDAAPQRDLQRGLWLRGRLTVDPNLAELDYQRLVVLYPSSPFAPQALLRLAQSAHANGDVAMASQHVASIVRDYPTSPVRAEAEAWQRGAGDAPPRSEASATTPPSTAAAPPAAATRDPATAPAPTRPPAAQPSTPTTQPARPVAPADIPLEWSVQFGAFTDENRAFALHNELISAGLAARLVRVAGSGFTHVRIGRFTNRAEASTQLQQVTARGFTAAIVRDDRAEEVVRR